MPRSNKTWLFSPDFRKIITYKILWKSIQWQSSCSVRTDRRTGMWTDKTLTVAFRSFSKKKKKINKNFYETSTKLFQDHKLWAFAFLSTTNNNHLISVRLVDGEKINPAAKKKKKKLHEFQNKNYSLAAICSPQHTLKPPGILLDCTFAT